MRVRHDHSHTFIQEGENLQRLKNNVFDVPMNDYLFQVLTDVNVVSEFIYIVAPTMQEARKRFKEKMKTDYGAGEYCLIGVYRKISKGV